MPLDAQTSPSCDRLTGAPRQSRYKAEIHFVSPHSMRNSFDEGGSCFLGVSLENSNFTAGKLMGILRWISRRFSRCTVLIGDSIHRITLESTRSLSGDAALAEALRLGRQFVEETGQLFDSLGDRTEFTFLNCSEVQTWDSFAGHHRRLREYYENDERFRSSVEMFGRNYHRKRSGELSDAERERRVRMSSDYFLEEFAIFACLRQRGLPVMVYPGSFSTLAQITNGEHPGAPEQLSQLTVVSLHLKGR